MVGRRWTISPLFFSLGEANKACRHLVEKGLEAKVKRRGSRYFIVKYRRKAAA